MSEIRVKDNESLEDALKRFRRQCSRSGVIGEAKKRRYYEKPSEIKKRLNQEARRNNRKRG